MGCIVLCGISMGVGGVSIVLGRLKWLQGSSSGNSEQSIFSGHLKFLMKKNFTRFLRNFCVNFLRKTYWKSISSHEWLTTSASSFAKKSTWRKEFRVVFHTNWSVQTTKKWSQIFRTFQLNKRVELMCFKSRFLNFSSFLVIFDPKMKVSATIGNIGLIRPYFQWFSLNLALI